MFGWDEEGGLGFAVELRVDDRECGFYAFRGGVGDGDVFEVGFSYVDSEDGGGAGWGVVGSYTIGPSEYAKYLFIHGR